jgi:hypothetical protein
MVHAASSSTRTHLSLGRASAAHGYAYARVNCLESAQALLKAGRAQ